MIVEFSVENFRSIKEMQTLNMTAANIVSKYKEVDESNLIEVSNKLSLLKSKAIYGANASGKSNIIKALSAFVSIVERSVKDETILNQEIKAFVLSTESEKEPTFFQLSFLLNGILYRYGFEATHQEVISEWLFGTPGKKEVPFFTREKNEINVNVNQFKEGNKVIDLYSQTENDIARGNSLFLTSVRSIIGGLAKEIVEFISDIIIVNGLSDFYLHKNAEAALEDEEKRMKMLNILSIADTGIKNLSKYEWETNEQGETKKHKAALTGHLKYDSNLKEVGSVDFFMSLNESEGSKKMFELSPFILKSLEQNLPIVIDEFDARIHPLLTKRIVELFNSKENKGSQFIFATHDTNLLDAKLLRRDQICFVEKDKYGASHYYTLAEFKGVRNDSSFEKDYISGRYGAIPFLGDFNSLIKE